MEAHSWSLFLARCWIGTRSYISVCIWKCIEHQTNFFLQWQSGPFFLSFFPLFQPGSLVLLYSVLSKPCIHVFQRSQLCANLQGIYQPQESAKTWASTFHKRECSCLRTTMRDWSVTALCPLDWILSGVFAQANTGKYEPQCLLFCTLNHLKVDWIGWCFHNDRYALHSAIFARLPLLWRMRAMIWSDRQDCLWCCSCVWYYRRYRASLELPSVCMSLDSWIAWVACCVEDSFSCWSQILSYLSRTLMPLAGN